MTRDDIVEHIKRGLESVAPSRAADFRTVRRVEDLDRLALDSITTLALVDYLEKRLGVAFSDDALLDLGSAADLVAIIEEQAVRRTPLQEGERA